MRIYLPSVDRMLRLAAVAMAMAAVLLLLAPLAEACPNCKNAISENSTEQAQVVQGYFWSILFMMSMPFLILGTFSSCMYVSVRRAKKRKAEVANTPSGPVPSL